MTGAKATHVLWAQHTPLLGKVLQSSQDPCGTWKGWIAEPSRPLVVVVTSPEQQKLMSLQERKKKKASIRYNKAASYTLRFTGQLSYVQYWHD